MRIVLRKLGCQYLDYTLEASLSKPGVTATGINNNSIRCTAELHGSKIDSPFYSTKICICNIFVFC